MENGVGSVGLLDERKKNDQRHAELEMGAPRKKAKKRILGKEQSEDSPYTEAPVTKKVLTLLRHTLARLQTNLH